MSFEEYAQLLLIYFYTAQIPNLRMPMMNYLKREERRDMGRDPELGQKSYYFP